MSPDYTRPNGYRIMPPDSDDAGAQDSHHSAPAAPGPAGHGVGWLVVFGDKKTSAKLPPRAPAPHARPHPAIHPHAAQGDAVAAKEGWEKQVKKSLGLQPWQPYPTGGYIQSDATRHCVHSEFSKVFLLPSRTSDSSEKM
jgi:hypothetical protein